MNEHVSEFLVRLLCDLVFESKSFSFFFFRCQFRLIGLWAYIMYGVHATASASSSTIKRATWNKRKQHWKYRLFGYSKKKKSVCGYFKSRTNEFTVTFPIETMTKKFFLFFPIFIVASLCVYGFWYNEQKREKKRVYAWVYWRCFHVEWI